MARDILAFLGLLLVAIVYQTLLAKAITIGTARPDIVLVMIVWLTLTRDLSWGVSFAFVAGIFEGSFSPQLLGLGAFLKIALAVAVYVVSSTVRTDSLLIRIGLVAAVVIVHDTIYFLVAYSFDVRLELLVLLHTIIPSAVYTSAVAAAVLYLSERQLTIRLES